MHTITHTNVHVFTYLLMRLCTCDFIYMRVLIRKLAKYENEDMFSILTIGHTIIDVIAVTITNNCILLQQSLGLTGEKIPNISLFIDLRIFYRISMFFFLEVMLSLCHSTFHSNSHSIYFVFTLNSAYIYFSLLSH